MLAHPADLELLRSDIKQAMEKAGLQVEDDCNNADASLLSILSLEERTRLDPQPGSVVSTEEYAALSLILHVGKRSLWDGRFEQRYLPAHIKTTSKYLAGQVEKKLRKARTDYLKHAEKHD